MAQRIIKIIRRMVYYVCLVGVVVLLLMMLLTASDIIGRSFFNRPIMGTYEISEYMLSIVVLFGIAYAQQTGQHVRVDLFANKLPALGRSVLGNIFKLIAAIFFLLVTWQGWQGGFRALEVHKVSDTLRIPAYPFEFLVAVGSFLLSLELILEVILSITKVESGIATTPKELTE